VTMSRASQLTEEAAAIKKKEEVLEAELKALREDRAKLEGELNGILANDTTPNTKIQNADTVLSIWEAQVSVADTELKAFLMEHYKDSEVDLLKIDQQKQPHGLPNFGEKIGEPYKGFGQMFFGKHTMKAGTTPEEEARAWSNLFGVNAVDTNNDGKVDRAEWEAAMLAGNGFVKACEEFGAFLHIMVPVVGDQDGHAVVLCMWEVKDGVSKHEMAQFISTQMGDKSSMTLFGMLDGALGVPASKFDLDW